MEYRAALLASHGFASMAIDYLTAKITIETGKMVDNQYFEVHLTKLMFWLQGNNVKKKKEMGSASLFHLYSNVDHPGLPPELSFFLTPMKTVVYKIILSSKRLETSN